MNEIQQLLEEAKKTYKDLSEVNPEAISSFSKYFQSCEKNGALSAKYKQIIMVAIGVVKQCKWCIVYHTHKAISKGATKEEIMEGCLIATIMGGGPSMMYSKLVMDAINEFS